LEGFAERSKISMIGILRFRATLAGFGNAIFRIVQECLTNIHRIPESVGKIRISRSNGEVRLQWRTSVKNTAREKSAINSAAGAELELGGMRERTGNWAATWR